MNSLLRPRIWPPFRATSGVGPCDVPFRYASEPTPCGCPVARPSSWSRYTHSWNIRPRGYSPLGSSRKTVCSWAYKFCGSTDKNSLSLRRKQRMRGSCVARVEKGTFIGLPASRSLGDVPDIAVNYLLRIKLERFSVRLEKAYQIDLGR